VTVSPDARSGGGPCPCGSGAAFGDCCGPVVGGERLAETAEALMRSRYTAFATGSADHLFRTWHPRTRPADVELDASIRWTGLVVLRTEAGGPDDDHGVVEFVASWVGSADTGGAGRGELHEVSRFARRAGRWLYVDGDHG
jgi:SEC-C motif-containing protein